MPLYSKHGLCKIDHVQEDLTEIVPAVKIQFRSIAGIRNILWIDMEQAQKLQLELSKIWKETPK